MHMITYCLKQVHNEQANQKKPDKDDWETANDIPQRHSDRGVVLQEVFGLKLQLR